MVKLIRFIAVISLIGLVFFAGALMGLKRVSEVDSKEGELEIYFENIALLPRDMVVGESYTIPLGFMSHNKVQQNYTYVVMAGSTILENKTIVLSPEENRRITILFRPTDSTWKTKENVVSSLSEFYLPINRTWIGTKEGVDKAYIVGNSQIVSNYKEYVYSNLTRFDIEELDSDIFTDIPLDKDGNYSITKTYSEGNTTEKSIINILIHGSRISVEKDITNTGKTLEREAFVVSVVGEDGRNYEINFWYTVR